MHATQLTTEQKVKAAQLNQGKVIYTYDDDGTTCIETEKGSDPLKWVDGRWKAMKS